MIERIFSLTKKHGFVFADQLVVSLGNFLTTLVLARALGLEQFGYFSALWLIALIANTTVMAVCVFPMMSQYAKVHEAARQSYLHGHLGLLAICCMFFTSLLIFAFYLANIFEVAVNKLTLILLIFLVVTLNLQELVRRIYIVQKTPHLALFSDLSTYLIRVLLLLCVWYADMLTLQTALVICVVTSFIGAVCVWPKYFSMNKIVANTKYTLENNGKSAKWLLPSGLMQWTSINLFISTAVFFISPAAVAILKVCQSIVATMNILVQAAENIIPMKASETMELHGEKAFWEYIIHTILLGVIPFVLIAVLLFFIEGSLLTFMYGHSYASESNGILFMYAISYIFVFFIVPIRAALRTLERTKIWFNAYVITTLYSVLTVYWLETTYGAQGAVFGIVTAHVMLITVAVFYMSRQYFRGKNLAG